MTTSCSHPVVPEVDTVYCHTGRKFTKSRQHSMRTGAVLTVLTCNSRDYIVHRCFGHVRLPQSPMMNQPSPMVVKGN